MSASAIVTLCPALFAALFGIAVLLGAVAVRPGKPSSDKQRLTDYAGGPAARRNDLQATGLARRLVLPPLRRFVRWLARRLPVARVEDARQKLVQAGNPYNMSAIDFMGLRVLMGIVLGVLGFVVSSRSQSLSNGMLMGLVLAGWLSAALAVVGQPDPQAPQRDHASSARRARHAHHLGRGGPGV